MLVKINKNKLKFNNVKDLKVKDKKQEIKDTINELLDSVYIFAIYQDDPKQEKQLIEKDINQIKDLLKKL